MGEGRREATPADIRRALELYRLACLIEGLALAILAAAVVVKAAGLEAPV